MRLGYFAYEDWDIGVGAALLARLRAILIVAVGDECEVERSGHCHWFGRLHRPNKVI